MKKGITSLAIVLSLSFLPAHSAEPPKAGSPCPKQGMTKTYLDKKFTCKKSGKNLVWGKGVAKNQVAAPTSSKTPVTTPSIPSSLPKENFNPWSTKFTTQVMSAKAFESFTKWSAGQSASQIRHELLIQPSPVENSPTIIQVLKKMDEISSEIFSQFMKAKSVTVLGFDEPWVVSQVYATGGHLRNSNGRCNEFYDPSYFVCMNRESHLGLVLINDCRLPPGSVSWCKLDLLPHEYFHLVQLNLADNFSGAHWNYGEDYALNSFPHWLVEGSANFVASAIVSMARDAKYEDARGVILYRGSDYMRNALKDYEIYRVNQPVSGNLNSYNFGHIATEYIVASIGFQKFIDIWKSYAVTRNFSRSFEIVTGRSLARFYEDFESARESLGVPPVTRKRD